MAKPLVKDLASGNSQSVGVLAPPDDDGEGDYKPDVIAHDVINLGIAPHLKRLFVSSCRKSALLLASRDVCFLLHCEPTRPYELLSLALLCSEHATDCDDNCNSKSARITNLSLHDHKFSKMVARLACSWATASSTRRTTDGRASHVPSRLDHLNPMPHQWPRGPSEPHRR